MNRGYEYREEVGPGGAGATVLGHLARRYPHSSEAVWGERIGAGEVLLEGTPAGAADVLRAGQRLVWRRPPWEEPPVPLAFAMLFRDGHLLGVAKPRGRVHAASKDGKPALTHVRVLGERQASALVEATIVTGRPHQIRIHLAAAGHPLVGDPLYAAGGRPAPDPGLPGDPGYRLHAHRLGLPHPATGRRLDLECPPPPELRG